MFIRNILTVLILMIAILPLRVTGQEMQNDSTMLKKIENYIMKSINDPIISKQECPIPKLSYFTAFARENLVEDPIVESDFFIDNEGKIYDSFDFRMIDYLPESEEERVDIALWILKTNRYVDIIKTSYNEINKQNFEVRIKTNYYDLHPYFGEAPDKNVQFIVSCNNGKWQLKDPKGRINP